MTTREHLFAVGALTKDYVQAEMSDYELLEISKTGSTVSLHNNGAIVTDNCKWIAVLSNKNGLPTVISHNGTEFGKWDSSLSTFFYQEFRKNKLETTYKKKITLIEQEIKEMAKVNENPKTEEVKDVVDTVETGDVVNDTDAQLAALKDIKLDEETVETNLGGADKTEEKKKRVKREETPEEASMRALRQKTDAGALAKDITGLVAFCKTNGSFVSFLVNNGDAVKFSKKSEIKTVADGSLVLDNSKVTEADIKAHNAAGKKKRVLDKSKYAQEISIGLVHSRAAGIKGAILKIPAGALNVSIADVYNGKADGYDPNQKEGVYKIFSKDIAEAYLTTHFLNEASEDAAIYGEGAGKIKLKTNIKGANTASPTTRQSYVAVGRKGPAISDVNHIPFKVYKTAPLQAPTPAQVAELDVTLNSLIKDGDADRFNKDTAAMMTKNADGTFTSSMYGANAKAVKVKSYMDKDKLVENVQVAVKEYKVNPESNKVTTPFLFHKLEDAEGALSLPHVTKILKAIGLAGNELAGKFAEITAKTSKTKETSSEISAIEYMALVKNNHVTSNIDFNAITLKVATMGK